ncbi:Reverse transcriptase (RNA-dependent DNA polymerase) [Roseomonas rosea]|uniref:Reverse transcriptase (RNA-dependent DNA polymerase) n=2 Tax=Muricoccus roseus TaxID=198092 RepID=A0A1M6RIA0_9PROT|nr:Reverse transcriptase (RNA-dependent DNA polymerase) [Roseomonas rosea]
MPPSSLVSGGRMDWKLNSSDLKRYPHFDKYLPPEEIERIVTDPNRVRTNAFFPFIRYEKSYQPFRQKGDAEEKPEKKTREIRYASRRDAYIFAYYRFLLSQKYNAELDRLGISDNVIAYRKILVKGSPDKGKCNIDFAKDAFDKILALGECSAVVLDISKYFESLDHEQIRGLWCRLFGYDDLPPDHHAVFKNITQYRFVERDKAYERLGFIGQINDGEKTTRGYLKGFKEMPNQLCSMADFRAKIAGGSPEYHSIIEKNVNAYGIPQGAPISDILANLYLIDFDVLIKNYVDSRGGLYLRYSDDIIVILPGDEGPGIEAREFVREKIKDFGAQLQIKLSKCALVKFQRREDGRLFFTHVEGAKGHNGLEYLGFRFDGEHVFLKDSTISGLYRKITRSLRKEAMTFIRRYPGKDVEFMVKNFNVDQFVKRFGRVEDFDHSSECEDWTFWTYARRAQKAFGTRGIKIMHQLKRHRSLVKERAVEEFRAKLAS